MLAFLTTSSIMAMNEANANGVAPGYKSVLQNENAAAVREIRSQNGFYAGNDPVQYAEAAPGLYVGDGKPLPF